MVITSLGESSSECDPFWVLPLINGACVREPAPCVSCLRLLALCMFCYSTKYLAWHLRHQELCINSTSMSLPDASKLPVRQVCRNTHDDGDSQPGTVRLSKTSVKLHVLNPIVMPALCCFCSQQTLRRDRKEKASSHDDVIGETADFRNDANRDGAFHSLLTA